MSRTVTSPFLSIPNSRPMTDSDLGTVMPENAAWTTPLRVPSEAAMAFMMNCMACHGPTGAGDGPGAAALNPKPRAYATEKFKQGEKPEEVFKTLSTGLPNTPMVSFAHLSEDERWALSYWVLELKKNGPKPDAGTKK